MSTEDSVYSGFKLCGTLNPQEKCILLREYTQGTFEELFHKHVEAYKLAEKVHRELLRTLVLRYEHAHAETILDAYLSRFGDDAKLSHPPIFVEECPEAGVLRLYCGGNVCAWIDTVIDPEKFRRSEENKKG